MEKNYTYVVHYERSSLISKGEYSVLVYRDAPIVTEADKESVKKLIRRKHIFSKCTFIWYKLQNAPYNAESQVLHSTHVQNPF